MNRKVENEQRLQELSLLRQQHQKYLNEINQTVNNLKAADQKLEITISNQISNFADDLKASTTAQVQFALNNVIMTLYLFRSAYRPHKSNIQTNFSTEQLTLEYDKILTDLKEKQKNFFRFHGFKHFIFLALPILQIANFILLICFLCK